MDLPSPKQTFAKGEHSKKWIDLAASDMWREAIHTALAQMTLTTQGGDPGFATKIQGAKEFSIILTNLAEPSRELPKQPKQNLNHNV